MSAAIVRRFSIHESLVYWKLLIFRNWWRKHSWLKTLWFITKVSDAKAQLSEIRLRETFSNLTHFWLPKSKISSTAPPSVFYIRGCASAADKASNSFFSFIGASPFETLVFIKKWSCWSLYFELRTFLHSKLRPVVIMVHAQPHLYTNQLTLCWNIITIDESRASLKIILLRYFSKSEKTILKSYHPSTAKVYFKIVSYSFIELQEVLCFILSLVFCQTSSRAVSFVASKCSSVTP